MRPVKRHLIAAVLCPVLFASGPVLAHSLESLQQELFKQEKYFQIKDEPAPEFALRDAAGDPVLLDDLRGKVIVLHFIYAGCPDVCPLHAERIGEIQEMVNITPMRDLVQFVTITTDPVRDGPEVMAGYGPAHGLDPANWAFLTSAPDRPEDATRALAEKFGHRFTPTDDGFQIHSVVTHIIDQNGRWVANFHGLRFHPTNLVLFLNGLVNDHHRPGESEDDSLWSWFRSLF